MKKRTIYSIIFYLIFWFVILMLRTDNFRDFAYKKGDFNDVIMENYLKESTEENFQQISISKYSNDDSINKTVNNQTKIHEALSLFEGLYLVEDKEIRSSQDTKYKISFYNINTYESLEIKIFDESHICVWIRFIDKKINKKTKTINYERDLIYHYYYIQNETINLEGIDAIFNSIDN